MLNTLQYSRPAEPVNRSIISSKAAKRAFDIAFALAVIVLLLSWVVPIIALLIKLDSRGPVFFKQLRTGKDGRPFYCFKFRSMRLSVDADSRQASRNDQRITKLGAFLRKSSIDEFPQFFNVLRGEMSIVGPRPHMLKHTEYYSIIIHNYMNRHLVMPGITGLAQVRGFRGETAEASDMINRVNSDIAYIKNWSMALDLKIILLSFYNLLKGQDNAR